MSFNAYLKIENIDGESTEEKHKDWIEILSYSQGVSQPGTALGGGGGGGGGGGRAERPVFTDFSVGKKLDKATPKLMLACASGQHLSSATLELTRGSGERQQVFMQYKMSDIIISKVEDSGQSGDDLPTESLSLNFAKIEWKYSLFSADGQTQSISTGWDLKKNQKV